MRVPRDITGDEMIRGLRRLGYEAVRQTGSHVILRTDSPHVHSVTIPNHRPIKVGTLSAILRDIASQRGDTVDRIVEQMKL